MNLFIRGLYTLWVLLQSGVCWFFMPRLKGLHLIVNCRMLTYGFNLKEILKWYYWTIESPEMIIFDYKQLYIQELTLRRNAITVLAFLASSGKPGFEIFVRSKLYREANFLMLILQVLVSEIDIEETAVCVESPEIFKER